MDQLAGFSRVPRHLLVAEQQPFVVLGGSWYFLANHNNCAPWGLQELQGLRVQGHNGV